MIKRKCIHVLLIEDDESDAFLIEEHLASSKMSDFEVVHIDRVSKVEGQTSETSFDVALLDLSLPDSFGLDTLFKAKELTENIPIIVLTGNEDLTVAHKAIHEGAQDYLVKNSIDHALLEKSILYAMERQKLLGQLKSKMAEVKNSEDALRNLITNNVDGILVVGMDDKIRFANPSASKLFEKKEQELCGQRFQYPMDLKHAHEIEISRNGDEPHYAELQTVSIDWQGESARLVTLHDITKKKMIDARLEEIRKIEKHMAYHDQLTGLPNRQLFCDRVRQAIAQANRYEHQLALLFLDLDGFKPINDTLGHIAGDSLLQEVAFRLKKSVRDSDTVARFGGDEFTILLSRITQKEDAVRVARNILDAITQPYSINGKEVNITTSIGISLYPSDATVVEKLVKKADEAMYRAKTAGENSCKFYFAMDENYSEQMTLENNLVKALAKGELMAFYQPQIELHSGKVYGVEALARWRHPEIGLIPPSKFIPIAEKKGLILELDTWMMREACRQCKAWQADGFGSVRVSVNLTATQFREESWSKTIADVLQETGMNPKSLVLEVQENIAMQDVDLTIATLKKFKELGVLIAIHQFGKHYSSLSYLKNMPKDILKIDSSFVNGLPGSEEDAAIIAAIIALAHSINLKVIAEGVENGEQFEFLKSMGCDEAQGFHISKPIDAAAITKKLQCEKELIQEPVLIDES